MSAIAANDGSAPVRSRRVLAPSIVSGLVVGLIGAIVVGIIAHQLASPMRTGDTTLVAAYVAFAIFWDSGRFGGEFGVGAAGPLTWWCAGLCSAIVAR